MEHPLIRDLDNLSLEDIQTKISELSGKLNFASRMGNVQLIHQLNMAIESYRTAYSKKISEMMGKVTSTVKIEKSNGN
jgi:hypothetical protein